MPNDRVKRIQKRNEKIKERFLALSNKKYQGKSRLYTQETILEMLSDEFYLSPRTIEDIVYERVGYKNKENE